MSKSKLIIENSELQWDSKRRYRVNAVVSYSGFNWQNLTGINTEPGVGDDWIISSPNEEATLITLSTISSMSSYNGPATTVIVSEKNRGGTFVYKTGSFTNDNGIIFTATGKGSGYWERQYTGAYINVQWFPNVVAEGITDCAAGINAIPNTYTYRYFPAGKYLLNSTINISGDLTYWSFIGDDTPMKTENKGTVFLANFSGNVFDTGTSYSYEGIQFKNFQIWHVAGGYGIRSGWPETRIENVRMLLEYGNGVNIAFVSGSNGAFDCTLLDVKIEGRFTDTPVTYSGTGLYVDSGSNNLLFANSFLYGFSNAIIIKASENVNIIQNNLNANGGDYAIKVLDNAGTINLNIENNYIESQNRAIYVGQAKGVHLVNNIINDAGFGGSDNLADAHLYFDTNTTSVSLTGNTITSSFQNQSFVYSPNDITLNDNHWTRNRTGSTFLGNNFDIPVSSWQRDILNTITSGSVVTNIRRIVGNSGTFTGNLSTGGATPNTYPLLVRAATNSNFRVSKLGTYPQIAFVDDTDSYFVAFSLGGNWQTFSALGAVNFLSLAGTGDRILKVNSAGDVTATDIAPTSGTYTPTTSGLVNITSISGVSGVYTRIGNLVTVTVRFLANETAANTLTSFNFTLPINRTSSSVNYNYGSGNTVAGSVNRLVTVNFTASTSIASAIYNTPSSFGGAYGSITFQYDITQ
jgi:hypothetical protein